jgi:hypothetical protein
MQIVATGATASLAEARRVIGASYRTDVFEPYDTGRWDKPAERFDQYCEVKYA